MKNAYNSKIQKISIPFKNGQMILEIDNSPKKIHKWLVIT